MQVNVYKVATKTAVFIHEKIITEEVRSDLPTPPLICPPLQMMRTCKESNMLLLFCLIEQLQTPLRLRQPEVILSLTTDCFHAIRALLEPLAGSSFDRLETLYAFSTSGGFIDFFLSSPDLELERIVIQSNLHNIMTPYEQDARQLTIYLKDQLLLRRRELLYLMNKPSLLHFLRKQETFQLFREWLQESHCPEEGVNWLLLYSDIKGYLSVTSHHLLPLRAQSILNKYLLPTLSASPSPPSPDPTLPAPPPPTPDPLANALSPPPPVDEVTQIISHLESDSFPKTLFNPLLQLIVNHLSPYFDEGFLASGHYRRLESELELIDMKIIAFFHEDPNGIFNANEEDKEEMLSMIYSGGGGTSGGGEKNQAAGKPSLLERMSFWQQG
jgi:hypothetical protein